MTISSEGFELLKTLVETPGVPGRESHIRSIIETACACRRFFDEINTDALGNIVCVRKGTNPTNARRILLAGHMDQTGFLVSHIEQDGALRLHPVGTCDLRSLSSQSVWVVSDAGTRLPGSICAAVPPIHTATSADLEKDQTIDDFYVDLGLALSDVQSKVAQGDMVVFRTPFEQLGNSIVGAGLDDRIGCWAMIEALSLITNTTDDLYFAFTVQEELGSRGAHPLANAIAPEIAIVCETVVSAAFPGNQPAKVITTPGQGVAVQIADSSLISDPILVSLVESAARAAGVSTQRSLMVGGGQDGAIIQRSGRGVKTVALGCPLKNMHTSREQASLKDVADYPTVIAAFLNKI